MTDHEKELELLTIERDELQTALDEALATEQQNIDAMAKVIVGTNERIRALQEERDLYKNGTEILLKAVKDCLDTEVYCASCASIIKTVRASGLPF